MVKIKDVLDNTIRGLTYGAVGGICLVVGHSLILRELCIEYVPIGATIGAGTGLVLTVKEWL